MPKKHKEKHITKQGRTLAFLRQQAGFSIRGAAKAAGTTEGVVNHLENGRIKIHPHHLEKLLPIYGTTLQTYEMFASGKVALPKDLRRDCVEIIKAMTMGQLHTAYPVLQSLLKNNE